MFIRFNFCRISSFTAPQTVNSRPKIRQCCSALLAQTVYQFLRFCGGHAGLRKRTQFFNSSAFRSGQFGLRQRHLGNRLKAPQNVKRCFRAHKTLSVFRKFAVFYQRLAGKLRTPCRLQLVNALLNNWQSSLRTLPVGQRHFLRQRQTQQFLNRSRQVYVINTLPQAAGRNSFSKTRQNFFFAGLRQHFFGQRFAFQAARLGFFNLDPPRNEHGFNWGNLRNLFAALANLLRFRFFPALLTLGIEHVARLLQPRFLGFSQLLQRLFTKN